MLEVRRASETKSRLETLHSRAACCSLWPRAKKRKAGSVCPRGAGARRVMGSWKPAGPLPRRTAWRAAGRQPRGVEESRGKDTCRLTQNEISSPGVAGVALRTRSPPGEACVSIVLKHGPPAPGSSHDLQREVFWSGGDELAHLFINV